MLITILIFKVFILVIIQQIISHEHIDNKKFLSERPKLYKNKLKYF